MKARAGRARGAPPNSRRRTATVAAAIGGDLCGRLAARAHQITAARIVKPPNEVAVQ
jgi:hypothetical protein